MFLKNDSDFTWGPVSYMSELIDVQKFNWVNETYTGNSTSD